MKPLPSILIGNALVLGGFFLKGLSGYNKYGSSAPKKTIQETLALLGDIRIVVTLILFGTAVGLILEYATRGKN